MDTSQPPERPREPIEPDSSTREELGARARQEEGKEDKEEKPKAQATTTETTAEPSSKKKPLPGQLQLLEQFGELVKGEGKGLWGAGEGVKGNGKGRWDTGELVKGGGKDIWGTGQLVKGEGKGIWGTGEGVWGRGKLEGGMPFPLSVEIQEIEEGGESVSPPRSRPLPSPSPLSPRKRGRKPKHYSEILFELGQVAPPHLTSPHLNLPTSHHLTSEGHQHH